MRISDWSSDVCSSDLPLEPRRLLARQPQITGGIFPLAQGARILARYPGEHDERFQIIARDARVIMIVRPQIELVVGDAVIGVGIGEARLNRAVERLPHRIDAIDRRARGVGRVIAAPQVERHLRRRLAIPMRSEEHTSELQSLMRTSYAVFCLEK